MSERRPWANWKHLAGAFTLAAVLAGGWFTRPLPAQEQADRKRLAQAAPFCKGRTKKGLPCLHRTWKPGGICPDHMPTMYDAEWMRKHRPPVPAPPSLMERVD